MKKKFIKLLFVGLTISTIMNSAAKVSATSKSNEESLLIESQAPALTNETNVNSSEETTNTLDEEKIDQSIEAQYSFNEATQTLIINSGDIVDPTSFSMYQGTPVKKIVFTGIVNLVGDCSYLFGDAAVPTSLAVIEGLEKVNTSQVTSMKGMFSYSENLLNVDTSHFDTSQVTDMSWMFNECSSLENVDISGFKTDRVKNMAYMFNGCQNLSSIDVSKFVTDQVIDMSYMFSAMARITKLDLKNFNTSQVTDMKGMFRSSEALISIDMSSFDMSNLNIQTVAYMFSDLNNLKKMVLGEKCNFYSGGDLPPLSVLGYYTGYWRNIGDGDEEHPLGDFRFNSGQLMSMYDGSIMSDTYVREALPIITLRNLTIYTGDTWKPEDNFISVEDIDGTYVSFDRVVVDASKVNTTIPGTYEVIYRYGGSIEIARVTVKQNKTAINIHDSVIYTGDSWTAKDNFDSALDKDGKSVPYENIVINGNVDTSKEGNYDVEYSYGGIKRKATIIVKDRQTAINVTLPTKMLFSVREPAEKKVESEIYEIKNNSSKDIEVSVEEDSFNCNSSHIEYLEKIDPIPTQIEEKIRLFLNIGNTKVQIAKKSETINFILAKNTSAETYFSGEFFGEVQKGIEKKETGLSLTLRISAI